MENDYIKHQIVNIINIQEIVTMQHFEFDGDFSFEGESHNFWEMVYVDRGVLSVTANKKEIMLSQGECYFHKPNEFHMHRADGVSAATFFVISFVCNSESMEHFNDKQIRVPIKLRSLISSIIDEGQKTFDMPFNNSDSKEIYLLPSGVVGGQQMVRNYLEQLLILFLRDENSLRNGNITTSRGLMKEDVVKRMKRKLDETAYTDIKVKDFCREMQYSKTYLSKIFLKNYGYTLNEYINKVKISEAKKLICEQRYTFAQIAEMLCFRDPFYFSKVFRRVTGMSPSEYKKSIKIN